MSGGWGERPLIYAAAYATAAGPFSDAGPKTIDWLAGEDPHGLVLGGRITLPVAGIWLVTYNVKVAIVARLTAVAYREWDLYSSDWDVSPHAYRGLQSVDADPAVTPHNESLVLAYAAWQDAATQLRTDVTMSVMPGGDQWRIVYGLATVAYLGPGRYPY